VHDVHVVFDVGHSAQFVSVQASQAVADVKANLSRQTEQVDVVA
jgi:hypothetical protein